MDPYTGAQGLGDLLASRRIILCVGCGGVGKTTTTAALGLGAARLGKRALCLTIDPAKRLMQSLGCDVSSVALQEVSRDRLEKVGVPPTGSLSVMRLDAKATFDELVATLATDPEKRQRILNNIIYKHVPTSVPGTQEYMAMEKLYAIKDDPRYDIIFLDTPPTANALDFLDAPERLVGALDSPATKWFVEAVSESGKFSLNLLAKSAGAVLKAVGKLTGSGFLEQVSTLISEINSLFGGWRKRADAVYATLRGPDVAFVLVTTPDPLNIEEVLYFANRLSTQGMRQDAFVVNRQHVLSDGETSHEDVLGAMTRHKISGGRAMAEKIHQAFLAEQILGKRDHTHLVRLSEAVKKVKDARQVSVPDFASDVRDLPSLAKVTGYFLP